MNFSAAVIAAVCAAHAPAEAQLFGPSARVQGQCAAWNQYAKAESQGPCFVDVLRARHPGDMRLKIHFGPRPNTLVMFPNGTCTLDGVPCRLSKVSSGVGRAVVSEGLGIEFPIIQ